MAVKETKPNQRAHKESKGSGRGSRRTQLSMIDKILISNGGMAHQYLRGTGDRFRFSTAPKRRGGKSRREDS